MANPNVVSLSRPITYEELQHNPDSLELVRDVMHDVIDAWFDKLKAKPYLKMAKLPNVVWTADERQRFAKITMEGTATEDPMELIKWMLSGGR